MKAALFAVRALAALLALAVFGHWIGAEWLTRVAATAMTFVLILAGVGSMWLRSDNVVVQSETYYTWAPPLPEASQGRPPPGTPLKVRTYRIDSKPRVYRKPKGE